MKLTDLSDLVVLGESVVVEEVEHQGLVESFGVRQVLELKGLKHQISDFKKKADVFLKINLNYFLL